MPTHLLSNSRQRPKPRLTLVGDLSLTSARVHEFCGAARRSLALMAAQHSQGEVFWIHPAWHGDRLNADGVQAFINPGRLIFLTPKRPEDLLWCMEEVLRASCISLVICELPGPAHLTPVRRLHLAAEAGAADKGVVPPLGLLLVPGPGGSHGVESRWHMVPEHGLSHPAWRLERRRDRLAPVANWQVRSTDPRARAGGKYQGFHLQG